MSKNKGFTLLELLVVVAIIAIIAVLAIPNFIGKIDKAKEARALAESSAVGKAVATYYLENGQYPTNPQPASGSPQSVVLSALVPNYLTNLPQFGSWIVDSQGAVTHGSDDTPIASGDPATMLSETQWATYDWLSVQPPTVQTSANRGVDSWGNPVNMDYWGAHTITEAVLGPLGTVRLNWAGATPTGYTGPIVDGQIIGYMPAYVKLDGETSYVAVTNVDYTFLNCTSLTTAPVLPNSVQHMVSTFQGCTSLTAAPVIPYGVEDMSFAFYHCSALTMAPTIPSSVVYTSGMLEGCTKLGY